MRWIWKGARTFVDVGGCFAAPQAWVSYFPWMGGCRRWRGRVLRGRGGGPRRVHVCAHASTYVFICLWMYVYACVSVYWWMYAYVSICVFMCVCVFMNAYAYVFILCVFKSLATVTDKNKNWSLQCMWNSYFLRAAVICENKSQDDLEPWGCESPKEC